MSLSISHLSVVCPRLSMDYFGSGIVNWYFYAINCGQGQLSGNVWPNHVNM